MHQGYDTRCLSLGLFGSFLLGSLLGLAGVSSLTLATFVLHVLIINAKSFINLSAQSVIIIKPVVY